VTWGFFITIPLRKSSNCAKVWDVSIAVGQVLEGMPDPAHLHRIDVDDRVVIMVGSRVLFCFAATDTGMRNLAGVTLAGMRFGGQQVAAPDLP